MREARLLQIILSLLFFGYYTVTSQQLATVNLLGHLDKKHGQSPSGNPPSSYSSCWGYTASSGREYAILGVFEGTSFIDISDPSTPREVGFVRGPNSIYREMKTYSKYAYIVSEGGSGIQIVDLSSLPDSVRLVKNWTDGTFSRAHTISQSGPYLYLSGGNAASNGGIAIFSLADPENPVKVGQWSVHYVHDCYIRNDTIYAAGIRGDGVSIIDARNKSNPQRIAQILYPGNGTHNAWTTEDGKYLLTTDEVGTTAKNLKIWDIRDLSNISIAAEFTANSNAIIHNVYVRGNYAHVAYYTEGYVVVDITDPTRPVKAGSYDTYSGADGIYAGAWNVYPYFPSGRIVLSDMQTGLYVFSFAGPVTSIPTPPAGTPTRFRLAQNYPNPFNPTTLITYHLPTQNRVNLKVCDLLGREVAILVDEVQDAGVQSVRFDADGLSSGVYFYRIQAGSFTETRKMLILR